MSEGSRKRFEVSDTGFLIVERIDCLLLSLLKVFPKGQSTYTPLVIQAIQRSFLFANNLFNNLIANKCNAQEEHSIVVTQSEAQFFHDSLLWSVYIMILEQYHDLLRDDPRLVSSTSDQGYSDLSPGRRGRTSARTGSMSSNQLESYRSQSGPVGTYNSSHSSDLLSSRSTRSQNLFNNTISSTSTVEKVDTYSRTRASSSSLPQLRTSTLARQQPQRPHDPAYGIGRKRINLTSIQKATMRAWFRAHLDKPYPTEQEKIEIAEAADTTVERVTNWFINARAREWTKLSQLTRQQDREREMQMSIDVGLIGRQMDIRHENIGQQQINQANGMTYKNQPFFYDDVSNINSGRNNDSIVAGKSMDGNYSIFPDKQEKPSNVPNFQIGTSNFHFDNDDHNNDLFDMGIDSDGDDEAALMYHHNNNRE